MEKAQQYFARVDRYVRDNAALSAAELTVLEVTKATLRDRNGPPVALATHLRTMADALSLEGDALWAATAMLRSGNILREANMLEEAVEAYEWVERVARESQEPWAVEMLAWSLGSQGEIANCRHDFVRARELLDAALPAPVSGRPASPTSGARHRRRPRSASRDPSANHIPAGTWSSDSQ
jgi:predicted TPR repeat methyltransferase